MIRKKLMIKRLWNTPEVYYKKGAISCLKSIDYSKFLVLIAEPIKNSEYYSKIEKYTQEKSVRIEIIQFLNQDEILKLRDKYLEDKPEVIVAIGGGSVIDPAKILRVFLSYPEIGFNDFHEQQFLDLNSVKLVAIPTTPGTGSESTAVAVIYDKDGHKHPYLNHGFMPDLAILDSNFLNSLPVKALYEFGADIFSHAIEGSVSVMTTPLLKSIGESSLNLLKSGFAKLKEKNDDPKAFAEIQYAGYLAGTVQGNAFVGVCHALAHTMEQQISISHAASILLLIKPVLTWYFKETNKEIYKHFLETYENIGFEQYRDPSKLAMINKDKWVDDALQDPSISTSPIRFKKERLLELIEWILKNE
ncbi:MAG: iron-containing alcohol dehydrogenase [Promethearchaeota archaeon]